MIRRRQVSALAVASAAAFLLFCSYGSLPQAAALPMLWQKCLPGSGAGECSKPQGIAVNSDSGNVYVVDNANRRINEFGPWGTFVKSWGWGVANGAAELQTCGPGATPPTATCQAGLRGGGSGQLAYARALTIDSDGNLYVYESKNCSGGIDCEIQVHTNRVQKFSSSGDFILMFGKEVNLSNVAKREAQEGAAEPVTVTAEQENICTASSGDTCGPGTQGPANGEFGTGPLLLIDTEGTFIDIGPGDQIYVGGQERIQIFDPEGSFDKAIPIPGKIVRALAVDANGNSFVAFAKKELFASDPIVVKLSPTGVEVCQVAVIDPRALAIDGIGRVYVGAGSGEPTGETSGVVTFHRFSSSCAEDEAFEFAATGVTVFSEIGGIATSSACGIEGNLYYANAPTASFLRAYYPSPDPVICPPPSVPPVIEEQYAEAVTADNATVRAEINPHFWPDATYYLQWGTEDCRSQPDACEQTELVPGEPLAGEQDVGVKTAPVVLTGLQPDTTYYYRFVASSGGGGPAYGIAPDGGEATLEDGLPNSFTTFPHLPAPKADCPNQPLRGELSERLPDCRAFEMVSPVDKEGGEIKVLINSASDPAGLFQSAADGNRMTYSSYRGFANPKSAPYTSQYLANRTDAGWSTTSISPPQEGPDLLETEVLESSYKAFSDDLCNGWALQGFDGKIAPDALIGYADIYRRSNCTPTAGDFEAITRVAPEWEPSPGSFAPLGVLDFIPSFQGASKDGSHTVFRSTGHLAPGSLPCTPAEKVEAGNKCLRQAYDFHNGELSLVCVRPSGVPLPEGCSVGTPLEAEFKNTHNSVYRAVSEDGSRIFWSAFRKEGSPPPGKPVLTGPGPLYVRINGTETVAISPSAPAQFWTAAVDGSKVIYNVPTSPSAGPNGTLFAFDVDTTAKQIIASGVSGVMGASEDATKIYFTSSEVLTSATNSEGDSAKAARNNLYLYDSDADAYGFIGTLAADDVDGIKGPIHLAPFKRTSRVSPDGTYVAFTSSESLTGAENLDIQSGEPNDEVFLYDADSESLRCVSCSASGIRPRGRRVRVNDEPIGPWIAGEVPGWTNQTHPSRALAADGSRLFFNSTTPLLLSDTNDDKDVYEWEPGSSQADCEAKGAELYLKKEGGCLSLISREGTTDSEFLDAGSTGRDVFFVAEASLVSQDSGGLDVYDAREGGGIAEASPPPPPCVGDACQQAPSPPSDPTPSSATFQGPESRSIAPRKGCPRGRARRKGRCLRKKQRAHSRRAQAKRNSGGRR